MQMSRLAGGPSGGAWERQPGEHEPEHQPQRHHGERHRQRPDQHAARSGSVEITTDAIPGARAYEFQINPGDPTQESNWQHAETSGQHRHLILESLSPGQTYWFRVRAIGKEDKGLWSGPVNLMVI